LARWIAPKADAAPYAATKGNVMAIKNKINLTEALCIALSSDRAS
jgi:hypothetical protein